MNGSLAPRHGGDHHAKPFRRAARPDACTIISAADLPRPGQTGIGQQTPPRAAQTRTIGPCCAPSHTHQPLATSSALAQGSAPKGWLMSPNHRRCKRNPLAIRTSWSTLWQAPLRLPPILPPPPKNKKKKKAPLATLTSHTKPSSPCRELFFDRMTAVDQIQNCPGRRDIATAIKPLSRRRENVVALNNRQRQLCATTARNCGLVQRGYSRPRDRFELVEPSRRYARSPRPRSSAQMARKPPRPVASTGLQQSPTRQWKSYPTPARSGPVKHTSAVAAMASVRATRPTSLRPNLTDTHRKRPRPVHHWTPKHPLRPSRTRPSFLRSMTAVSAV